MPLYMDGGSLSFATDIIFASVSVYRSLLIFLVGFLWRVADGSVTWRLLFFSRDVRSFLGDLYILIDRIRL